MTGNFNTTGLITAVVVVFSMFFLCGCSEKTFYEYTLEIPAEDVLMSLTEQKDNPYLLEAVGKAKESEQTGIGFIESFGKVYNEIEDSLKPAMAELFAMAQNQAISTDDKVVEYLTNEYDAAIENACNVIVRRMELFGVKNPTIHKDSVTKGCLHLKLPGLKEPERIDKLLTQSGAFEFWETYNNDEIHSSFIAADQIIVAKKKAETPDNGEDIAENTATVDDTVKVSSDSKYSIFNRLFARVGTCEPFGPVVGFARKADMESIMSDLNSKDVMRMFPKDLVFAWGIKEVEFYDDYYDDYGEEGEPSVFYELLALKATMFGKAALNGDVITDASAERGVVSITMDSVGSIQWERITRNNIGRSIAMVFDNKVYSYPVVYDEITGGCSQISGNFTDEEAEDFATILKSGRMPVPAKIISRQFVDLSSK
jgi:SecD/SecF fusion protein